MQSVYILSMGGPIWNPSTDPGSVNVLLYQLSERGSRTHNPGSVNSLLYQRTGQDHLVTRDRPFSSKHPGCFRVKIDNRKPGSFFCCVKLFFFSPMVSNHCWPIFMWNLNLIPVLCIANIVDDLWKTQCAKHFHANMFKLLR